MCDKVYRIRSLTRLHSYNVFNCRLLTPYAFLINVIDKIDFVINAFFIVSSCHLTVITWTIGLSSHNL